MHPTRSIAHLMFLSPHPDDAVLSCGGWIHQLAVLGAQPHILTLFGGDPLDGVPLSPFAQQLHARWQLGDDAPAARRAEDQAAAMCLAAEVVQLMLPEAIYRTNQHGQYLYASEEAIFGEVHDPEWITRAAELIRRFVATLSEEAHARLVVPLTAGHHVDHQIARLAAEHLTFDLIYYEDYPYAETPDRMAHVWGASAWASETIELSDRALAAKIDAFLQYRSQISTFFRDDAEVAQRIRSYAELVGNGRPAERYWRRTPVNPPESR